MTKTNFPGTGTVQIPGTEIVEGVPPVPVKERVPSRLPCQGGPGLDLEEPNKGGRGLDPEDPNEEDQDPMEDLYKRNC